MLATYQILNIFSTSFETKYFVAPGLVKHGSQTW